MELEFRQSRVDSLQLERFLQEVAQDRWRAVAILPLEATIHQPRVDLRKPVPDPVWQLEAVLVVLQRTREER